jgi:septal ring factor EnvC (AmiA/AmiB activator)
MKNVLKGAIILGVLAAVFAVALLSPVMYLMRENRALHGSLEAKQIVIERLQREIEDLAGMLQNKSREAETLQLQLETCRDLYLNATEEILELNATIDYLNWKIRSLEGQVDYYKKLKSPELSSLQRLMDFSRLFGTGNYTYFMTFRNASMISYFHNASCEYLYLNMTARQVTAELVKFEGATPLMILQVESGDYFYFHAEKQDGAVAVTIRMENVTLTDGAFVPHLNLKVQLEVPK